MYFNLKFVDQINVKCISTELYQQQMTCSVNDF